jgi:hypothetical protein
VTDPRPKLILRLGTHAEKEYVEKVAQFLDGIIFGANLLESTPGATASLVVALSGAKSKLPYYIDPMTYAYGTYVDASTGELREDLDWIKSDQKVKGEKKKTERLFKRSYQRLCDEFGSVFSTSIDTSRALVPAQFSGAFDVAPLVGSVLDYQLTRIKREFEADPEFRNYADQVPSPTALIAPYFYCEPSNANEWLSVNLRLASAASQHGASVPIHAIVCAHVDHLVDAAFMERLVKEVPKTGVAGVWLWFSRFAEDDTSLPHLSSFRRLVHGLSKVGLKVFNLHGGFFSLALSKFGLTGVSHGIGYGEQKDVVPVIGQSIPTVRYYLPALHKRLGVPDIERAFDRMGVKTVADFHAKVCDCPVCKGLIVKGPADFQLFGETQPSASLKSAVQTPQAARRCRFHFLISRIRERDRMPSLSVSSIQAELDVGSDGWGAQPSLQANAKHLMKWRAALG